MRKASTRNTAGDTPCTRGTPRVRCIRRAFGMQKGKAQTRGCADLRAAAIEQMQEREHGDETDKARPQIGRNTNYEPGWS